MVNDCKCVKEHMITTFLFKKLYKTDCYTLCCVELELNPAPALGAQSIKKSHAVTFGFRFCLDYLFS